MLLFFQPNGTVKTGDQIPSVNNKEVEASEDSSLSLSDNETDTFLNGTNGINKKGQTHKNGNNIKSTFNIPYAVKHILQVCLILFINF